MVGTFFSVNTYALFELQSYWNDNRTLNLSYIKQYPHATFVSIFGTGQLNDLKKLEDSKEIKIVFKAPMAVNGKTGHGTRPRNTLVIYELNDEVSKV